MAVWCSRACYPNGRSFTANLESTCSLTAARIRTFEEYYTRGGTTPGGGNLGFSKQMSVLKEFLHGFEFIRMKPDEALVKGGLPKNGRARTLSEPGKQYGIYFFGGPSAKPLLTIPAGKYQAEWLSPVTGKVLSSVAFVTKDGPIELASPKVVSDIALRIKRIEAK